MEVVSYRQENNQERDQGSEDVIDVISKGSNVKPSDRLETHTSRVKALDFYLKKSRGCLMMNALGIVYLPANGYQTYVGWKQISKIDAASGLMRAYDITGKRLFTYTYGLRKHDALWALVRHYTKTTKG